MTQGALGVGVGRRPALMSGLCLWLPAWWCSGTQPIPNNELALAQDLYTSLQEFYRTHKQYKDRPLYITGEVGVGVVSVKQDTRSITWLAVPWLTTSVHSA